MDFSVKLTKVSVHECVLSKRMMYVLKLNKKKKYLEILILLNQIE